MILSVSPSTMYPPPATALSFITSGSIISGMAYFVASARGAMIERMFASRISGRPGNCMVIAGVPTASRRTASSIAFGMVTEQVLVQRVPVDVRDITPQDQGRFLVSWNRLQSQAGVARRQLHGIWIRCYKLRTTASMFSMPVKKDRSPKKP